MGAIGHIDNGTIKETVNTAISTDTGNQLTRDSNGALKVPYNGLSLEEIEAGAVPDKEFALAKDLNDALTAKGNCNTKMEYISNPGTHTINIPNKNSFSIIMVSKSGQGNLYVVIYGQVIPIIEKNSSFTASIDSTGLVVTINSSVGYFQIGTMISAT